MYYLIEITNTPGSPTAKAVWDKETLDAASMQLHQTLASAMASESVANCLCMIIDAHGAVLRHEYWERQAS